jgi:cell division protein FtsL
MSKFFHLSKKSKVSNSKMKLRVNAKLSNVVLVLLIVVFGLGYLIQINGMATKGYQIRDLEDRISELQQEKADLQLEALSLQSMGKVQEKVDNLGMVLANEAEYLMPTPVAVAR